MSERVRINVNDLYNFIKAPRAVQTDINKVREKKAFFFFIEIILK